MDDDLLEPLMVLLGTDVRRLLLALGARARTGDPGWLCGVAELAAHGQTAALPPDELLRAGVDCWQRACRTLSRDAPDLLAMSPADPRSALPVIAGRVRTVLPAVDLVTAALLAACVVQRVPPDAHILSGAPS